VCMRDSVRCAADTPSPSVVCGFVYISCTERMGNSLQSQWDSLFRPVVVIGEYDPIYVEMYIWSILAAWRCHGEGGKLPRCGEETRSSLDVVS
jgi:hypothetical protein